MSLHDEIDTLGYPPAALLAYSIALVTYNLLALVKTAMRAVHVDADVSAQVSTYYLANETTATWSGLEIAVPAEEWNSRFGALPPTRLATILLNMAQHTDLRRYRKHVRGVKRKPPPRSGSSPHVSTARLLAGQDK